MNRGPGADASVLVKNTEPYCVFARHGRVSAGHPDESLLITGYLANHEDCVSIMISTVLWLQRRTDGRNQPTNQWRNRHVV